MGEGCDKFVEGGEGCFDFGLILRILFGMPFDRCKVY